MSEIVYHVASSLDGFIADIDGGVDWLNEFHDPDTMEDFMEFFNSFECIALGGHTYDFALKHGQWMSPNTPSWVFTSRDLKILHPSIQLTTKIPEAVCQEMDDKEIKRVWLMGRVANSQLLFSMPLSSILLSFPLFLSFSNKVFL